MTSYGLHGPFWLPDGRFVDPKRVLSRDKGVDGVSVLALRSLLSHKEDMIYVIFFDWFRKKYTLWRTTEENFVYLKGGFFLLLDGDKIWYKSYRLDEGKEEVGLAFEPNGTVSPSHLFREECPANLQKWLDETRDTRDGTSSLWEYLTTLFGKDWWAVAPSRGLLE